MSEQKNKIKAFLARFFGEYPLQDDEDIFAKGIVNSLFAMQLVMFIEKEFNVTIGNEDLELANFRTINLIDKLVQSKITPK